MYKNILVPVSFEADRNAKAAMAVAQKLGGQDAKITCMHVMEHLPRYATEYLPAGHLENTKAEIIQALLALAAETPGAASLVLEGAPSRTILDHAKNNNVDLIVIAGHQPGVQDYLLGSTAAKVVRHAHCAVHVIR
ncbi:MAG: universal stress protein [Pseudomonadota bacterium]